ncbi:MAG: HlyD family efflux transporter periplasmic adaptor subunit [Planctomycetes bacterium]|nr:HlyD family efflux transporter periplasmic adaptor subunit [Planctomycetota bacterium]
MRPRPLFPLALCLAACAPEPPSAPAAGAAAPAAATDRIDVPAPVRENLGVVFVPVERRRVAVTLRLPGHFELLPAARVEHRTPIAGRVHVAVQPLQPVVPGDLLYTLDSPEWRRMQRELGELRTELQITAARIATMQPLLEAHHAHEQSLREAAVVVQERLQNLEATRQSVGGQATELAATRVQLAQLRAQAAEAAEHHAETAAKRAELEATRDAGEQRFRLMLAAAATHAGTTPEELAADVPGTAQPLPRWQQLDQLAVRATAAGLAVELPVASGAWVETGGLVTTVVDLERVRFRAKCPQGDLARVRAGQPARVVTSPGDGRTPVEGRLLLGAEADPTQRTLDLFLAVEQAPDWARPGFAAFLEFETAGGAAAELAIPRGAVMRDGLRAVFFRRDPANPDRVIRVEADLGVDDGRWVEVKSGLVDGDTVVLAGAYELMLASSGTTQRAGHFHADGTFHDKPH